MKRVLYCAHQNLTVFHWHQGQMMPPVVFFANQEGFTQFGHYLAATQHMPVRCLVDTVEEEFRVESLPHTFGLTRQALMARHVQRYQRSHQFATGLYQGATKTKPRKDVFLFAFIREAEHIMPWLQVMDQYQVIIEGIWSSALLMQTLFYHVKTKSAHTLLITPQSDENIRLSYFKERRLVVSRAIRWLDYAASRDDALAQFLKQEIYKTSQFLRNQKYLQEAVLHVVLVWSPEAGLNLKQHLVSDAAFHYHFRSIDAVCHHKHTGIHTRNVQQVLSYLCSKANVRTQHYAKPDDKAAYQYFIWHKVLGRMALIFIMLAFIGVHVLVYQARSFASDVNTLRTDIHQKQHLYDATFADQAPILSHAKDVHNIVDFSGYIQEQAKISPLVFSRVLAASLDNPEFNRIHIQKIEWERLNKMPVMSASDTTHMMEAPVAMEAMLRLSQVGIVHAVIPIDQHDYRVAVETVKTWVMAIEAAPDVAQVNILDLPVEIRSHKSFEDTSGVDVDRSKSKRLGRFSIQIFLKPSLKKHEA